MAKKPMARVRMRGTTYWLVRPGDEITVEERMAKRWQRSNLADIIEIEDTEQPEEQKVEQKDEGSEATLEQLRRIAQRNDIPIRGSKAEIAERLSNAGIVIETELNLLESELS